MKQIRWRNQIRSAVKGRNKLGTLKSTALLIPDSSLAVGKIDCPSRMTDVTVSNSQTEGKYESNNHTSAKTLQEGEVRCR